MRLKMNSRLRASAPLVSFGLAMAMLVFINGLSFSAYAQQELIRGIEAPEDFDWGVFEFDKLQSRAAGDDLIEYDTVVTECVVFKDPTEPDAADMFFTEEKLAKLERCMAEKGYRLRAVNDFSLYQNVPSNRQLNKMIQDMERANTVGNGGGAETKPSAQRNRAQTAPDDRGADRALAPDADTVEEQETQPTSSRNTGPAKKTAPLPNQLFVPVE